jgi:hypothetical protein
MRICMAIAAGESQQEAAKRRDTPIANERSQQIGKRHNETHGVDERQTRLARVACVHASAKPRVAQGRHGGEWLHVHEADAVE